MVPLGKINPSENKATYNAIQNYDHKSIEMAGNDKLTSIVKPFRKGRGKLALLRPSGKKKYSAKRQPKPPLDDNSEMSALKNKNNSKQQVLLTDGHEQ